MAKKKKPETASIVVPEAEQPYQIPDNWRWVKLSYPTTIIMGQSPEGDATTDDSSFLPLIGGAADMGELYPNATRCTKQPTKISKADDVILCVRATLGRPIYSDGRYCLGRGVAAIRPNIGKKEFYRYALTCFEQYLIDHATGSTFAQISSAVLKNMPIPFPPLAEQQRIVDRIESLFTALDEVRERVQAALDGLELYRGAVLREAFNGTLTAEWRQENGLDISSWRTQTLKECCKISSGGTPSRKKPEYYKGNIPWIKTGEIDWNEIANADEYITESAMADSSAKLNPAGAVLVAMYGMGLTRGRAAILKVPAATNQAVCVLQPNSDVLNWYLFYYFMRNYWQIRAQAVGGNQLNLSGRIISQLQINIPVL